MALYGLRQAGFNWFQFLTSFLLNNGFTQSYVEPCLFYNNELVILIYVDDTLFIAKNQSSLDDILSALKRTFLLTEESDIHTFLGINFTTTSEGNITLTQTKLIDKVLALTGLATANSVPTPATTILDHDNDGLERETEWHYRQIVGILTYISYNTRPDITFAVNQVSRFCNNPKRSHERAVKRILRYLRGTRTNGIIIQPTSPQLLDCYVDADFSGLWKSDNSCDPISVRSRTGYVIMFCGTPLLWCSKLQSEVALSTVEAEYIALSQSMRDLLPTKQLLQELQNIFKLPTSTTTTTSTVFEDNAGAIELARCPKMRPRTKDIAVKYHHFRDHVQKGGITIKPISTTDQIADLFTKPLPEGKFLRLRQFMIGW